MQRKSKKSRAGDPEFCAEKGISGLFCGSRGGLGRGLVKKKFGFQRAVIQSKLKFQEKKVKKNFGVSENGCIFAPAFDRGARP